MTEETYLPPPSFIAADINPRIEAMLIQSASDLNENEVNEIIPSRSETDVHVSEYDRLAKRDDLLAELAKTSLRRKIGHFTLQHLETDRNIRARHRNKQTQQ